MQPVTSPAMMYGVTQNLRCASGPVAVATGPDVWT